MKARYQIIDIPLPAELETYRSAVTQMIERLKMFDEICAIYQIGSVSTPGISDIDMVAVFADETQCLSNPRARLDEAGRYLFVHDLYGATKDEFRVLQQFSLFHNYRFLWGTDIRSGLYGPPSDQIKALKIQVALEFLVRMYINMCVQRAYGVIKLRGFLLHSKAIGYDLDFLDIDSGNLYELTMHCIEIRNQWFQRPIPRAEIGRLFDEYFQALIEFLADQLEKHTLYLPERQRHFLSSPIELSQSKRLDVERSGLRLPRALSMIGPRYFNLQNRVNKFLFSIPFQTQEIPPFLAERFRASDAARLYHSKSLPYFAILMSSLAVQ